MGFVGVLALFASVSILSFGILPRAEIQQLSQPSVGGVLAAAVGNWGAVFIGIGVIVSVLGAYLAWTLMAAEVLSIAAKKGDMPSFLAKENANQVPSNALLMSTLLVQAVLAATLFSRRCIHLCAFAVQPSLAAAVPAVGGVSAEAGVNSARPTTRRMLSAAGDMIVAVLATIYSVFLVFAGGMKFLVLSFLIYASRRDAALSEDAPRAGQTGLHDGGVGRIRHCS